MKRDIINEIKSIRERTEFNSRHDFTFRLNNIENGFKANVQDNRNSNKEFLKYIPIATIACIEAFFRSAIKDLIDFGKPYSDNVINFNQTKNVKFDFDIVNAVQSKTLTVGEFISHIVPCNNFDDINSNISTLIGIDFITELKIFQKESIFNDLTERSKLFIGNSNEIISDIKKTFELRHIFCHEFANDFKLDKDEIYRRFNNSKIFLNQSSDFILHLLYPNSPETQMEMNSKANSDFKRVDEELSKLVIDIKKYSGTEYSYLMLNTEFIDESIEEWKKYRNSKAKFDSALSEGGSIYPLIYANSLTNTTMEKLDSLKSEYAILLRKNVNF